MAVQPDYRTTPPLEQSTTPRSSEASVDVIDRIAPEWRALCAEGSHDEPFYRPEWIAASFVRLNPWQRSS